MNRLVLGALLATLVGCASPVTPPVVEARPQLQHVPVKQNVTVLPPRLNPQPFEGAIVSISVIVGPANLDCLECRGTMRAGRALVQLLRLTSSGDFEPYGDNFAVLVSEDFDPLQQRGRIIRCVSSSGAPHRILSHILNQETGEFLRDVTETSWVLIE